MSNPLSAPSVPDNAVYTACWCEENVYLLGMGFLKDHENLYNAWKVYAVFMSNESKTVRFSLLIRRHPT